jgi:hypothetical protein
MRSPYDVITDQVEAERLLESTLRRLNARILGMTLGLLSGLVLFAATNILVLRGGENVGAHLKLLGWYFPGYDVTFSGSFVGAAWAFAVGYVGGATISRVYNLVSDLKFRRTDSA